MILYKKLLLMTFSMTLVLYICYIFSSFLLLYANYVPCCCVESSVLARLFLLYTEADTNLKKKHIYWLFW
jgi:hypothetical protein